MQSQSGALKMPPQLEPAGEGPCALQTGFLKQLNYQTRKNTFPEHI